MFKPSAPKLERQTNLTFGVDLHGPSCYCANCRRKKTFEIPSELAKLFIEGDILLFTGAGISTESRSVISNTFYETIEYALNDGLPGRSFPDLMEAYCRKLVSKLPSEEGLVLHHEPRLNVSKYMNE